MITSQEFVRAQEIKRAYLSELMSKRNVVASGIGYKERCGQPTGELSVKVSVASKVPLSTLSPQDQVPSRLDGVPTDVVETGVFRAFEVTPSPRGQWRPVRPGVSVGHVNVSAGTFGCLVQRGRDRFILSNNHVLANCNACQRGDAVLQPAAADGGTPEDQVAALAEFVPLDFGTEPSTCPVAGYAVALQNFVAGALGSNTRLQAVRQSDGVNQVDAALARLTLPASQVSPDILGIGLPSGVGEATLGTRVQKSGRTTGTTSGQITQIEVTVRVDYREHGSALFSGQLMASPMSQGGDSGSAILDMGRKVVGLLFAGSDASTLINPIALVLAALNVEVVVE